MPDLVGAANVGATARPRASGRDGSESVVVELQQVVRGRDEPPFASACGPASPLEASDLAVELDLTEHGLDGDLAQAVEGAPGRRGEHAAHEVIEAAGPAGTGALAQAGVGCDEHLDAVADDRFDLALMPVAGVAQHDLGVGEIDGCQLAPGGADHRFGMSKAGDSVVISAAITSCWSLTAICALSPCKGGLAMRADHA